MTWMKEVRVLEDRLSCGDLRLSDFGKALICIAAEIADEGDRIGASNALVRIPRGYFDSYYEEQCSDPMFADINFRLAKFLVGAHIKVPLCYMN